ncbi:MAG: UDP-N-acetylmuramoyl-tripeptide--D-alanyl-D-alanine ligase [Gammaproteobacteria bacterium]
MKLSSLYELFGFNANKPDHDVRICTDTRTLKEGDAFVALVGEQFDGHDYVSQAMEKGASVAIVSRKIPVSLPQIEVKDTLVAYGDIAHAHRMAMNAYVMSLTGSCGKTTTKEYVAQICGTYAPTLSTYANLNNEIGVPKTLLELRPEHRYAVIEMGANQRGEIGRLTAIARPNAALITLVAAQHTEGFGSVDNVAKEKGAIYAGVMEGGVAILPRDDQYYAMWHAALDCEQFSFGFSPQADLVITDLVLSRSGSKAVLQTPQGAIPIETTLVGKHNIYNAAAAVSLALMGGVPVNCIKAGIARTVASKQRMNIIPGHNQATLIDDCYNAGPVSVMAALEVLATYPGEKVWVFADMKELGNEADRQHVLVGEKARELGIQQMFAVGEKAKLTLAAFGTGASHFESKEALVEALLPQLHPQMTVLIKGSRSNRLETVVDALKAVE